MNKEMSVAEYLFGRLKQIGVDHLFGVPGDYNLWLLEEMFQKSGIEWCSNSNELNAAYAADGYARIRGVSALITTFGVGELSALNGVAGSAAECVPVIHIVGAPPLGKQREGSLMHHTFGDGDFNRFHRIYSEVVVAHALLDEQSAKAEIDRVIAEVLKFRKPGYIVVPMDVVHTRVSLEAAADRGEACAAPSAEALAGFRSALKAFLDASPDMALIAGHLAERFGAKQRLRDLVARHGVAHASLIMGKGVLDEQSDSNLGLYVGGASEPEVRARIEGCGALIAVGVKFTDAVTGGFTDQLDHRRVVDVQPFETVLGGQVHPVRMRDALSCLDEYLCGRPVARPPRKPARDVSAGVVPEAPVNQIDLWKLVEASLGQDHIVVADLGTTFFGVASVVLPSDARLIAQPLWGSIGYAIPAAYGVLKASPGSKLTLIVGDGSALLTAQEIGVMLRDTLTLTVLLLNNGGYTIERLICNPERAYHDVPAWDWQRLPSLMGRNGGHVVHFAATNGELRRALAESGEAQGLSFIEVVVPKLDAPALMTKITQSITNRK